MIVPSTGSLRAIADVHGDAAALDAALSAAPAPGFVLQLGDLVDRGPDSAACIRRVLALRAAGAGIALRGNHDDKLARLLLGHPVKAGADLQRTVAQLRAQPDADALIPAFLETWTTTPWWLRRGARLFVHAAFHPAMLDADSPGQVRDRRTRDKVKWLSIYGEGRMAGGDDLPQRSYGWIDLVPDGVEVVVGHDVRCEAEPLAVTGALGGSALFLDTGCGKGGPLSWLDIAPDGTGKVHTMTIDAENRGDM